MTMTPREWNIVDRALSDAAANARTEREEDRILGARHSLMRFRTSARNAAAVTATMNAIREARRLWGLEGWVLEEIEAALTSGRQPDLAAARDRRRRTRAAP